MRPSQVYVADNKKWTDLFVYSANNPMLYTSLRQRGGTWGTELSTALISYPLIRIISLKRNSRRRGPRRSL